MTTPFPAVRRARPAALISAISVAALAGAAILTATPSSAADASAAGELSPPSSQERVVSVGGGDRVALTPLGSSAHTTVTALPGADGAAPGLVLATTEAGSTVQSTDPGSTPTVIAGHAEPRAATDAADPGDTVPLHVSATGRDGRPADAYVSAFNLDTGAVWTRQLYADPTPSDDCTTATYALTSCVLVPPGNYSVMAFVDTLPAQPPSIGSGRTYQSLSLVGQPQLSVNDERTVDLDARAARPLTVKTPGHRTKVPPEGAMLLGYDRTAANGMAIHIQMHPSYLLDQHFYLQPTAPVSIGTFGAQTRLRLEAPDIAMSAPTVPALHPEYVDRVWFSDVASDFPVVDGHAELRVVDVGHATAADLAGRRLHGAIALVTHSADLSIAEQSNNAAAHGAGVVVIRNDGPGDISDPGGTGVKLQVPTIRLNRAEGLALGRLPQRARVTVEGEPASPYVYDLYLKEQGRIPADPTYVARTSELATQTRRFYGQPNLPSTFSEAAYPWLPGDTFATSTVFPVADAPRVRTEYRVADPDTAWNYAAFTPESPYNVLFPQSPVLPMSLTSPGRQAYAPGDRDEVPAGRAPIVPAPNPAVPVQRAGDLMRVSIAGFTDADGNFGSEYTQASGVRTHLAISADDTPVASTDYLPSGTIRLPAGDSHIAISFTTDDPQPWDELSTHTDTTWSFPSSTTAAGAVVTQPLLLPSYDVDVDLRNRVRADGHHPVAFDLRLRHPDGVPSAAVRKVLLEASYDDGTTWRAATLTRETAGWRVELPRGSGPVSLRLRATDADGSAVDQTVIRAFEVR